MHLNDCASSNRDLLPTIRRDENEEALHQSAFEDWAKGRMTEPMRARNVNTDRVRHIPRTLVRDHAIPFSPDAAGAALREREMPKSRWHRKGASSRSFFVVMLQERSEEEAQGHQVRQCQWTLRARHDHKARSPRRSACFNEVSP